MHEVVHDFPKTSLNAQWREFKRRADCRVSRGAFKHQMSNQGLASTFLPFKRPGE